MHAFQDVFRNDPPDSLNGAVIAMTDPPDSVVPAELNGTLVTSVTAIHTGSAPELAELIAPLLAITPTSRLLKQMPYTFVQSSRNGPAGLRSHWRSEYLNSLDDATIAAYGEWIATVPEQTIARVAVAPWGGAVADYAGRWPTPFRHAPWVLAPIPHWDAAAHDDRVLGWMRAVRDLPGHERLETGESADHERLRRVKAAYDPANVFHLNRNIRP